MPQGIQVMNASGGVEFDTADSVGRILALVSITSSGGNTTDARLQTGRPFWVYMKDSGGSWSNQPDISVSGDTLTWSWPVGGGANGRILYGVY